MDEGSIEDLYGVESCVMHALRDGVYVPIDWEEVPDEVGFAYMDAMSGGESFSDGLYALRGSDLVWVAEFPPRSIVDEIKAMPARRPRRGQIPKPHHAALTYAALVTTVFDVVAGSL